MKLTLLLLVAIISSTPLVVEIYNLSKTLETCYNSGELLTKDGKRIQCVWINSDEYTDKQGDK
jgi:hypothetical protein